MEGRVRPHRKRTRQPATSRQRKRSKRSAATNPPRNRRSFAPGEDIEVARLTRERDEALEQQAAISEGTARHQRIPRQVRASFSGHSGICGANLRCQIRQFVSI